MKSFKNKNVRGSSWGRVWLAAWLAVAALLVGRSLWLPGAAPRQVASASPVADAELTRVSLDSPTAQLTHTFKPIEELRVGMRVVSDNPETDTPEPTAVDPATWRLVKLYAEERWPDGTLDTIHIETLQPPAWLELFQAKVGSQVPPPLDLVEMGLPEDLDTSVVAIEPCPRLESGPGRVVLTTVNHLNNDVWELSAENALGAREKLRPTGSHKFYSETRRTWVSTKQIHDNEVIRGRAGPLTIVASRPLPGTQRVYNLTVEGEHVYYVSDLGLLAHNNCSLNARELRINLSREGRLVQSDEAAGHIVASTGSKGQFAAAARSREILKTYSVNINDAANGIPIGHPRPHNLTHSRTFNEVVESRLLDVVGRMQSQGRGYKAIRTALRKELRTIGREVLADGS